MNSVDFALRGLASGVGCQIRNMVDDNVEIEVWKKTKLSTFFLSLTFIHRMRSQIFDA